MSSASGGSGGGRRRRGLGSLFTTLLQPGSAAASGRQGQPQQQQQQATVDAEDDERRLQRLAKNRESAQRSRQRKKEYLELLQERVHQTNATLEGLRAAHVAAGAPRLAAARAGFLESCAAADAGAGMDEEDVEAFLRAFGPWAEERQALLRHDCDRLKGAVLPPPARFWTWLAQQPDAFFTAATEGTPSPSSASASASAPAAAAATSPAVAGVAAAPSAAKAGERLMQEGAASCGAGAELWPLLCFELQLKPEQEAALRRAVFGGGGGGEAQQQGAAAVDVGLAEVAATLAEADALEAELQEAGRLLDSKLRALHRVLTPAQALALEQALASS